MTHVHADLLVTSQIHYATAAIAEVEGVLLPFGGTAAIRLDFLMRHFLNKLGQPDPRPKLKRSRAFSGKAGLKRAMQDKDD